jgi:hypothetical protein
MLLDVYSVYLVSDADVFQFIDEEQQAFEKEVEHFVHVSHYPNSEISQSDIIG